MFYLVRVWAPWIYGAYIPNSAYATGSSGSYAYSGRFCRWFRVFQFRVPFSVGPPTIPIAKLGRIKRTYPYRILRAPDHLVAPPRSGIHSVGYAREAAAETKETPQTKPIRGYYGGYQLAAGIQFVEYIRPAGIPPICRILRQMGIPPISNPYGPIHLVSPPEAVYL